MNNRVCINCCSLSILMLLLLIGCSCTDTRAQAVGVSSVMNEQEVRLRISGAREVIGELRTPEGCSGIARGGRGTDAPKKKLEARMSGSVDRSELSCLDSLGI